MRLTNITWIMLKHHNHERKATMRNGTDGTIIHPGVVEKDSGQVALVAIVIVSLVLVIVGLIVFVLYRHYTHRNSTTMNFDNPVYRKTTEDQFSLEKNIQSRMYPSTVGEEINTFHYRT